MFVSCFWTELGEKRNEASDKRNVMVVVKRIVSLSAYVRVCTCLRLVGNIENISKWKLDKTEKQQQQQKQIMYI